MKHVSLSLLSVTLPWLLGACMVGDQTSDPADDGIDVHELDATTCGVLAAGAAPQAEAAIHRACSLIGTAYSWGGGHAAVPGPTYGVCDASNGAPNDCHVKGLDCSGMVRYAYYLAVGADVIPGASHEQYQSSRAVARYTAANGKSVLRPGDLVFFGGSAATIHHVAMYLGADTIVESPFSGGHVRMVSMSIHSDYYGAIRLYKPSVAGRSGSSAVRDSDGVYHVFGVDQHGDLQQAYYTANVWQWQSLGGVVQGTPAVTYNSVNDRFDVFAIGTNGYVYQKTHDSTWHDWHNIGGGSFRDGASAFIDRDGMYHVFSIDTSGVLHQGYYAAGAWHWQALGGTVTGTPGVVYRAADNRIDVFALAPSGYLYQKTYSLGGWQGWHRIGGGTLAGGVGAVIDDAGTYHVFVIDASGVLHQGYYTAGNWVWQPLGGTVAGTPSVVYRADEHRYDVFAVSPNGHMYQKIFSGTWQPWHLIGGSGLAANELDDGPIDTSELMPEEAPLEAAPTN